MAIAGVLVAGATMVLGSGDEPASAAVSTTATASVTTAVTTGVVPAATSTSTLVADTAVVSTVIDVVTRSQYDNLPFNDATVFGDAEEFPRSVTVECGVTCELVFDDAEWIWDLGLRLPIENNQVDATFDVSQDCISSNGELRGTSNVHFVSDLVVSSTRVVGGRAVPDGFTGTIVFEADTVPYETPTGQGECTATRFTVSFPENGSS